MAWRITYWRGTTPIRVTKVEEATQDEIESLLRNLAARQLDLEYLRASDTDKPEDPTIRSNRDGTMFWTTGRDFHYTAEWSSRGDRDNPKR